MFFRMIHTLKRNLTKLVRKEKNPKLQISISSLFQVIQSWNLKCKFKYGFSIALCKKVNVLWFQEKRYSETLNALPVYNDRYIKTKIRAFHDKVSTNFRGLNVPEDDIACQSFTVISIDSVLSYEKIYYLQVYLDNGAYKIVNKQMTDYLDENLFEN